MDWLYSFGVVARAIDRLFGYADEEVLLDPFRQFLDDLAAANRLKTYIISGGIEVPEKWTASLAELTAKYLSEEISLYYSRDPRSPHGGAY